MNNMHSRLSTQILVILALFIPCLIVPPSLYGEAHLRALIAADTQDPTVAQSFAFNQHLMQSAVRQIGTQLQIPTHITSLQGKRFSKCTISEQLDHLASSMQKEDIVIIYMSCHGGRLPSRRAPWPILHTQAGFIDGQDICQRIQALPYSVALIIFDSCNSNMLSQRHPLSSYNLHQNTPIAHLHNISHLFSKKMLLIITASSQYKVAIGWNNGGIFTRNFIRALGSNAPSWENVVLETSRRCLYQGSLQNPICHIEYLP